MCELWQQWEKRIKLFKNSEVLNLTLASSHGFLSGNTAYISSCIGINTPLAKETLRSTIWTILVIQASWNWLESSSTTSNPNRTWVCYLVILYHLLWCTLAKLYRNCLPIKILSHIICTFCDLQDDALNYFIVISNFWYIIFEHPNATAVCLRGLSIHVSLLLAFFCMCVTLLYHRHAWSCSFAKSSSSISSFSLLSTKECICHQYHLTAVHLLSRNYRKSKRSNQWWSLVSINWTKVFFEPQRRHYQD